MSCTAVTTSTQQPDTPKLHLLTIAPELRNYIWALALVSDKAIIITTRDNAPKHQPPGVLTVNKQVRREASGIYYTLNPFEISIINFDVSHLAILAQQRRGFGYRDPATIQVDCPETSWKNVIQWAKWVREDRLRFKISPGDEKLSHPYWDAVMAVFDFVKTMKNEPWEDVARDLEWVRISPEGMRLGWSKMRKARV